MLRCLIADDEAPARLRLRDLLARLPDVVVLGEADDGLRTLEQVQEAFSAGHGGGRGADGAILP